MACNILFITTGLLKGGAETQLLKVARFLKARQFKVRIVSLKPLNDFNTDFGAEGLDVVFLKNWKKSPLLNCFTLFRSVKEFKADVVIAFMFVSIIFARFLKMWFGFKLISSIRTSVISNKWRQIFKLTSGWDDLVLYNSQKSKFNFEQNNLVKRGGLVINNAISIPQITYSKSSEGEPKNFVWISMAHFVPEKDYKTLFRATALIKNRNFRIDILGNLYHQDWPFEMIEKLEIRTHINLLGLKTETEPFLHNADGFVLSSFLEGMPNALLEAMAHNKPIIASSVDGIEELLSGVNCGFLFKQGDELGLAEKMSCIMDMTVEERYALGKNGRQHVEKTFSEEKVLEEWLSIVEQFSEKKKTPLTELLPQ